MGNVNEVLIVFKNGLRKYGLLVDYQTNSTGETENYQFVSSEKIREYKATGNQGLIDAISEHAVAYIDTNLRF